MTDVQIHLGKKKKETKKDHRKEWGCSALLAHVSMLTASGIRRVETVLTWGKVLPMIVSNSLAFQSYLFWLDRHSWRKQYFGVDNFSKSNDSAIGFLHGDKICGTSSLYQLQCFKIHSLHMNFPSHRLPSLLQISRHLVLTPNPYFPVDYIIPESMLYSSENTAR